MSASNRVDPQQKKKKKSYTKPTMEIIELLPEERIAKGSGNCQACQGQNQCAPGGHPGGGQ